VPRKPRKKRKALKKVHLAKKAKEEKDASNKIDAKNVDALAELDFGFGDAGMESDE